MCIAKLFPPVVRATKAAVHAYSGSAVRGEGNYKIAERIVSRQGAQRARPYTCVVAWVGLDGALLCPPAAHLGEAWADFESTLTPLLREIQEKRRLAGISSERVPPALHATDTYGKHRMLPSKICCESVSTQTFLRPKAPAPRR